MVAGMPAARVGTEQAQAKGIADESVEAELAPYYRILTEPGIDGLYDFDIH